MHRVEVVQLPCRWPRSIAACVGLLSGLRLTEEPFQVAGEQFAGGRFLLGGLVGSTEHWVSALTALGEDLGERRLAVSSVHAVEGGLLPALLGSRLAGRHIGIRLDVIILERQGNNQENQFVECTLTFFTPIIRINVSTNLLKIN